MLNRADIEDLMLEQQMGQKLTSSATFGECREALLCLLRREGLTPDEKKVDAVLSRYSLSEIERMLDAFYRFGVKEILTAV